MRANLKMAIRLMAMPAMVSGTEKDSILGFSAGKIRRRAIPVRLYICDG